MNNKLVIISGTSSGLGLIATNQLILDGYRVIGISRRKIPTTLINKIDYHHYEFDLSEVAEIPNLVNIIVKKHGVPYGLINNAASGCDGLLPTMHNSEIISVLNLNILSPIILSKYVSRKMLENRTGRIINISSIIARTGYKGLSVYAASKSALEGFSRSLARDLGSRGVTVNCIAPGFMSTEMTENLNVSKIESIKRRSALGKFTEVSEVVGGIQYLLSPIASGVTGTTLTIDSGSSA
jgi:3-oxoacyl-[acyl-carrier protein] reductase